MMNTANSTLNPSLKPASVAAAPQTQAISMQPTGIIPIITTERLSNSAPGLIAAGQNHEHLTGTLGQRQSVATFIPQQTIHAIATNNTNAANVSSVQSQIQTAASIIHSGGLTLAGSGNPNVSNSVVSIIPSTVPVASIPVSVRSVSVLSTKPPTAISAIGPRYQTTNVIPTNGPQAGQSINLLIHHPDSHIPAKNLMSMSHGGHHHIQTNATGAVMKTVSNNTATAIFSSSGTNASTPLFIQTQPTNILNNAQSILPVSASQVNATNLSTITLSTSQNQHAQQTVQQQQLPPQAQSFQKLKVEDALSYLDQVKFRFSEQPHVYNDFLDIMKEFKSHSIDTPGVIHRVSTLFQGHPELIVGFNTFLPPGYKIELRANEVNVSTPTSSNFVLMTSTGSIIAPTQHQLGGHATITGNLQQNGIIPTLATLQTNQNQNFVKQDENNFSTRTTTVLKTSEPFNDFNARGPKIVRANVVTNESNNQIKSGIEFNNAINYVNKIKNRFSSRPDVYKEFLDILQNFQNDPQTKTCSQAEKIAHEKVIFEKVALLFENHDDLLEEFNQFLPDSAASRSVANLNNKTNVVLPPTSYRITTDPKPLANLFNQNHTESQNFVDKYDSNDSKEPELEPAPTLNNSQNYPNQTRPGKRANSGVDYSTKRTKLASQRDSTFSEAGKYVGDLSQYVLFDKIRGTLNCSKSYENFLRCLALYNQEIFSKSELIASLSPFLNKYPDLFKRFKDVLNVKETPVKNASTQPSGNTQSYLSYPNSKLEGLSHRIAAMNRNEADYLEIDVNACKRFGASYRTIPKNSARQECSGRTPLCHEVLNDTLVSFPTWSEDSTFVSSKKINYEEYLYRCEDERYELDQVLETNLATIRLFDNLLKKMEKMSPEEKARFKLDDNLGGRSEVIHQKAIKRIYGDKAVSVIEALKNAPAQSVAIVYRRLLTKEEEWRDAQKQFNKMWREQYEKYYQKSLDHQGANFKQNDIKNMKPKLLFNEILSVLQERQKEEELQSTLNSPTISNGKPHITLQYPEKAMVEVVCNLVIHHVKRQTSINKEDKQKIKQLMKHFIPDLFGTPRGELSDDEGETEREEEVKMFFNLQNQMVEDLTKPEGEKVEPKPLFMMNQKKDDQYSLFFINEWWYCFFRYHYILCDRLAKMHKQTEALIEEDNRERSKDKKSFAQQLGLKNDLGVKVEDYFKSLIDMVKQVLDGNLESVQYEDTLREMYGINAYISFTLDKLVQYMVKQLQNIVADDVSVQCVDMYLEALKTNAGGGSCSTSHKRAHEEAIYQKAAEQHLQDEYCFKLVIYRDQGLFAFEYLPSPDTDEEDDSGNENEEESVSTQSSRTTRSTMKGKNDAETTKLLEKVEARIKESPLFLTRSISKYKTQNREELKQNAAAVSNDLNDDLDDDVKSQSNKEECELNLDNYKSVLIIHNDIKSKNSLLYKRNSLENAHKSHEETSKQKHNNFEKWHKVWTEENCKDKDTPYNLEKLLKKS